MDVVKVIEELRTEREQMEEAILVLERIARGHGRPRGRPPAWMTENQSGAPSTWQQEQAQGRRCSLSGLPLNQSR
jgi:hypothetical protein